MVAACCREGDLEILHFHISRCLDFTLSGEISYQECDLESRKQFDLIRNRDHVSWNAIIVGYVQNEEEEEAFNLFWNMRSEGVPPDEVSLTSILNACSKIQSCERYADALFPDQMWTRNKSFCWELSY